MEVPAGFAARRNGDDRGGDHQLAVWIGKRLADNGFVVGKDGGEQRLVLRGRGGCFLGHCRSARQCQTRQRRRADPTQLKHTLETPTGIRTGVRPVSNRMIFDQGKQSLDGAGWSLWGRGRPLRSRCRELIGHPARAKQQRSGPFAMEVPGK